LLIVCVLLKFIIELLNTAIEVVVNSIPAENTLSAKAKDVGNATVLMASKNFIVV